MKINQYCSVCKKHLDMEVIPTDDAGDDGVIWLRCPECMGFLPKFSGDGLTTTRATAPDDAATTDDATPGAKDDDETLARRRSRAGKTTRPAAADPAADILPADVLPAAGDADKEPAGEVAADAEQSGEPISEYAAQLAEADLDAARPYRPTAAYAIGDVVHHLAYDDVGVVVAKESLPGGRLAVKVFFEKVGIVRLIEQASGGA